MHCVYVNLHDSEFTWLKAIVFKSREYALGIMNYQNALQKESVFNRHIIKSH